MKRHFSIFFPVIVVSIILWPKLPTQDRAEYFEFADGRALLGVPNWQNVLSNIPFFLIGLVGYLAIRKRPIMENFDLAGRLYAMALMLTAFGSGYFHWGPTPQTLFWDRLPMALGFGGLCSLITIDRLYPGLKKATVYLIAIISVLTVMNWIYGNQDLRPYLILQFVGGFYVLLVSLCTRGNRISNPVVFVSLAFYVLAKILEVYDRQIYSIHSISSGHTLKHLIAAMSTYPILLPWIKNSGKLS